MYITAIRVKLLCPDQLSVVLSQYVLGTFKEFGNSEQGSNSFEKEEDI